MWSPFAFFGPPCQPRNGPEPPCQDGVHVHSHTNNLTSMPSAIPAELHNRAEPEPLIILAGSCCSVVKGFRLVGLERRAKRKQRARRIREVKAGGIKT